MSEMICSLVFFEIRAYNKSVILKHQNLNKNVRDESMERFILIFCKT